MLVSVVQLQKWDCTKGGGHERDEQDEDILISRSLQYAPVAVGAAVVKLRGESMDFQHATTQGQ